LHHHIFTGKTNTSITYSADRSGNFLSLHERLEISWHQILPNIADCVMCGNAGVTIYPNSGRDKTLNGGCQPTAPASFPYLILDAQERVTHLSHFLLIAGNGVVVATVGPLGT